MAGNSTVPAIFMHKLVSPVVVQAFPGPKGLFRINLNTYRNAHFRLLNAAKIAYKQHMQRQIEKLPQLDRISVHFVLYPGSARSCDIGNIASITEKFVLDAMVELGKLPDDNYKHVIGISSAFGAVDRFDPRVEVLITPHPIQTGATP